MRAGRGRGGRRGEKGGKEKREENKRPTTLRKRQKEENYLLL